MRRGWPFVLLPTVKLDLSEDPTWGALGSQSELDAFAALRPRLAELWDELQANPSFPHTTVVVPSLSVDQGELRKIPGASFYEERLLFTLIRLTNPAARVVYVTSQPLHPDVLEYYLQHVPGVPMGHAMQRLLLICLYDGSPAPLTAKLLERPRVIERMRQWIGDTNRAYLTCYNSSPLERRLAVELGIPMNSADPELLWLGTKSGSRKVFSDAGVPHPLGANDLRSSDEVVAALDRIARDRPAATQAIVKLNDSFAGEGNGVFRFPDPLPADRDARLEALSQALGNLELLGGPPAEAGFMAALEQMGGVVEERITGEPFRSPSVQLRINPDGELQVLSTHDQILGGSTGQSYVGCRFPADDAYREAIQRDAIKVGQVLAGHGVVGRFGVDFVATSGEDDTWSRHAIEINLRMGGTTPPFMALEFLTGGRIDPGSGLFRTAAGQTKYYFATDKLQAPAYRGLLPEDLVELLVDHGLQFRHDTMTGVLFFMIGALSQFGKLGITSIANTQEEADRQYETVVAILDRETGARVHPEGAPHRLFPLPSGVSLD